MVGRFGRSPPGGGLAEREDGGPGPSCRWPRARPISARLVPRSGLPGLTTVAPQVAPVLAQLAPVLPYLLMVLLLIFRPKGLMGTREG